MNSTVWHSLTGFIQYLGSSGKCKIDEGDKGWYIAYIDQEAVMRKEEDQRKAQQEKDDEERHMQIMEGMVQRGLEADDGSKYEATELIRNDPNEKITLDLNLDKKPTKEQLNRPTTSVSVFEKVKADKVKKEEPDSDSDDKKSDKKDQKRRRSRSRSAERRKDGKKEKKSALDEIREMEERKKERKNRKDYWMKEGIVVKVS